MLNDLSTCPVATLCDTRCDVRYGRQKGSYYVDCQSFFVETLLSLSTGKEQ